MSDKYKQIHFNIPSFETSGKETPEPTFGSALDFLESLRKESADSEPVDVDVSGNEFKKYTSDDDDVPEDPGKNSEEPLQHKKERTDDFLKYKILFRDGEERNRVLLEKNREILKSKGYIEDNLKKYYIDIKIGKKAKENPGKYEKIYELARNFLDKKILEAKYGNQECFIGLVLYILEKTDYSIYMIDKMKGIFNDE